MSQLKNVSATNRDGAIVPLFAILLPVLLILAAFAVNISSYQLTATELRIATDVASHAGGRSLNVYQNMDEPTPDRVINAVRQTIDNYYVRNLVAGQRLTPPTNFEEYIEFYNLGTDRRARIDASVYERSLITESAARSGENFNGVGVLANIQTPSVFDISALNGAETIGGTFNADRRSVTRQNERDIAIVVDRSGSMLFHNNDPLLIQAINDLEARGVISERERDYALGRYRVMFLRDRRPQNSSNNNIATEVFGGSNLYQRRFDNLPRQVIRRDRARLGVGIQALRRFDNPPSPRRTTYGDRHYPFNNFDNNPTQQRLNRDSTSVADALLRYRAPGVTAREAQQLAAYAVSWEQNRVQEFVTRDQRAAGTLHRRPDESRWDYLERGIQAYVDVLDETPAQEQLSLVVFNSSANIETLLTSDYQLITDTVEGIVPNLGTSIHDGMEAGLNAVLQLDRPVNERTIRPFAERSIVIMTDGNNSDRDLRTEPVNVARRFAQENPEVTLHTLTFGTGAGTQITTGPDGQPVFSGVMVDVARVGRGFHFHAEEGEMLIENLETLALILPTIFTF